MAAGIPDVPLTFARCRYLQSKPSCILQGRTGREPGRAVPGVRKQQSPKRGLYGRDVA